MRERGVYHFNRRQGKGKGSAFEEKKATGMKEGEERSSVVTCERKKTVISSRINTGGEKECAGKEPSSAGEKEKQK